MELAPRSEVPEAKFPKRSSCPAARPGASPGHPRPGRRGKGLRGDGRGSPRPRFPREVGEGRPREKVLGPGAPGSSAAAWDAPLPPSAALGTGSPIPALAPGSRPGTRHRPTRGEKRLLGPRTARRAQRRGDPLLGLPRPRRPLRSSTTGPPVPRPTPFPERPAGAGCCAPDAHGRPRVAATRRLSLPPRGLRVHFFLRVSPPRPPRSRVPGSPKPRGLPVPRRREVGGHLVGGGGAGRTGWAQHPFLPRKNTPGARHGLQERRGHDPPASPNPQVLKSEARPLREPPFPPGPLPNAALAPGLASESGSEPAVPGAPPPAPRDAPSPKALPWARGLFTGILQRTSLKREEKKTTQNTHQERVPGREAAGDRQSGRDLGRGAAAPPSFLVNKSGNLRSLPGSPSPSTPPPASATD